MTRAVRRLEELDELGDLPASDPEAWFLRAAALCDLERNAEAADAARAGLACDPRHLPLLALLAGAEAELGDLARAERTILWALELAHDDPWLLSRYALLVARAGQLDKARGLVALAERAYPDHVEVLRARSMLAYLEGRDRQWAITVGAGPIWLGAVAAMIALVEVGHTAAAAGTAGAWIVWVAYSWIVPPLLRR